MSLVLLADPARSGRVVRQARVQPTPRRWPRASGPTRLEATAPVAVSAGGAEALMMDVVISRRSVVGMCGGCP